MNAFISKARALLPQRYYPSHCCLAVLNPAVFSSQCLQCGYRFIDCANDYDNEDVIGEALQELFEEGVCKRLVTENYLLFFG